MTVGGQLLGEMYLVIGWLLAAGAFAYLAMKLETMPPGQRKKLPTFMQSKGSCLLVALLMLIMAVAKYFKVW